MPILLFGYKKGAFTGANKDTKGLIEEADNGYLFLDEVHRLSPEGHETMLDTFLRRIPVDVVLPDFQERTLEEKYELILFMIHQEAKTMRATFQVSSNVINRLLTFQGKGNIGTLKNIIRLSCAKAYNERTRGQEVISFNLSHLSSDSLLLGNGESIPYINETIKVSPDQDAEWKISMTEQQDVDFSEEVMNNLVREYLEKEQGVTVESVEPLGNAKHIFSHVEWHMNGYLVQTDQIPGQYLAVERQELQNRYAIPNAFQSYYQKLMEVLA